MSDLIKKILLFITSLSLLTIALQLSSISRLYQLKHLCTVVNEIYQVEDETERNYLRRKLKLWNKIARLTGYDVNDGLDNGNYCLVILDH